MKQLIRLKPIPRCEVCERRVVLPGRSFFGHTLCPTHCDMARGAHQWLICKLDRVVELAEDIQFADAVVQCHREEYTKNE